VATIDIGLEEGVLCPFRGELGTRIIQCGVCRGQLPYQVASSSIQPFGHNISTNYYLVVEMHTVTNGRPKTVRPMLSDRCLSVLSVLSVTFVHCGQTVERIKMKLGTQVGLGPGHIVLDGNPAPLPQRGTASQFSIQICCGQMAAWIKMSLGMELGLGPGDIVLDGDPARPPQKGGGAPRPPSPKGWRSTPNFRPMFILAKRLDG